MPRNPNLKAGVFRPTVVRILSMWTMLFSADVPKEGKCNVNLRERDDLYMTLMWILNFPHFVVKMSLNCLRYFDGYESSILRSMPREFRHGVV